MKKTTQFFLLSVALLFSTVMTAQVTASSMSGRVTDVDGPVMGATVVATHVPSGTTYGTVTNDEGRYNLPGMRVGGPYSVSVSYVGYGTNTTSDITISLGAGYLHDVVLSEESVSLSQVVISAKRTKFATEKTGAVTNISNEQMTSLPSVNRSITDIAKLSPYSNGMSMAGGDGRSTNFTVDGANFNNNFGLSSSLPAGGSPISLDAIEEVQIVIAPFDVRQSNFIGGGINAITKSGTNKFKGSAYTYFNNQDMRGNRIGDVQFGDRDDQSKTIYGLTLGGPILKNKLFFFVNAETEKRPGQVVNWRPSENGEMDLDQSLSRTSVADMERVKQHLISNYGYDPGSYSSYPADETNKKILVRMDWNINDAHKLSVRYNYAKNQGWNGTNGNSTDAGYRFTQNRISQYAMAFSNSTYSMDNIVNSISFDLNSRISDKLSNQLLVTSSKIKDMRGTNSSPFPFIDIMNGLNADGNQILEPYMTAGLELFTHNNGVNNNTFTVTDNLTYYMDSHKITGGLSFEHQIANNSYMRNGTGYYRYASIEDFLNQEAPTDFVLTYGYDGEKNPTAEVSFNQFGAYLQDDWDVNPNFKLSYGIRADYLKYEDNILTNNAILGLDFGGKNIDTGKWPKANVQVSPRVGFTWDIKGDQSMKLRGGTGIFSGRLPLVFFTNMPTNSGMVQAVNKGFLTKYKSDGSIESRDPMLDQLKGPMITDVDQMIEKFGFPNTISPEDGLITGDISGIATDFKMPQVWKSSIAFDYDVPVSFPLSVTVEGIYTKTMNGVMLKNYNIKQPDDSWERFSGPDDRYIYPDRADRTYTGNNAFVLSNTSKGWGAIGNITVNAEPVEDLRLMAAYTYTESQEITGMPGSNAGSAYSGLIGVNGPHLPELQRSQYVVPSRVIGSAGYKLPWSTSWLKSSTLINVFYSGFSSNGYSYMYSNDMNGDGASNDLIYIPKGRGDINFVSQADEDAFFAFMEQDKYLKNNKGKYAEANAARSPWVHTFDLRLVREYYINVGETQNTLQFSLDFLNVGNMLNSEWGVNKINRVANNGRILNYIQGSGDANTAPTFAFNKVSGDYISNSYDYDYHYNQTWKLQVGAKYSF